MKRWYSKSVESLKILAFEFNKLSLFFSICHKTESRTVVVKMVKQIERLLRQKTKERKNERKKERVNNL